MKLKNETVIKMSGDQLMKMVTDTERISANKELNPKEIREAQEQMLSFGKLMEKCSNGRIVPVEMKSTIKDFENAGMDISKLKPSMRHNLEITYNDLKRACSDHPGELKNTPADVYCKLFEFFGKKENRDFANMIKSDPFIKKEIGRESLDAESIEEWLADNPERSEEIFGLKTAIGAATGAIGSLSASTTFLSAVLIICLILITVFMVLMFILTLQYKAELTKLLAKLTEKEVEENGAEETRRKSAFRAAIEMSSNTGPLAKHMIYKPVESAIKTAENMIAKSKNWFDKTLKDANAKKGAFAKESYEENEQSEEGVITAVGAAMTSIFAGVSFTPVIVVVSIILIIIMIKPIVYAIYRWKLKCKEFFDDEADMVNLNIEELEDMKLKATSDAEKQRLQKIIDKQRKVARNLAAMGNFFYKTQSNAAMDARDDVRDDDNTQYGDVIDQTNTNPDEATGGDTPVATDGGDGAGSDGSTPPTDGRPVILF